MKKITLTLSLVFISIISFSQIQSNCNVPSILYTEYDEVVTDLAIRRIYQVNSPDTVYITVPQVQKDTIWEGLAAIFNAPIITGWDSVFNKYCIKQTILNNMYFSRKLSVTLDTNYSWTQHWINEELITGYTELDNFISENEFINVTNFMPPLNNIDLSPDYTKYINFEAFKDSLLLFDGIISASTSPGLIDGNIITYNKINNIKYYNFSLRYGDCFSGCQNWYTFKYKVNSDCSVEFLGIEETIINSEPFPLPTNCNIASSIKINENNNSIFSVYPNPVKESLYISLSDNYSKTILIYDIYGREVKKLITNNSEFTIQVGDLQSGIYLVKIGTQTVKFVKE